MQLDRTEMVIRQRTALELFDLSLVVLKRHIKPIMLSCGLIGLPLLAFDVWAVAWMMNEDSYLAAENLPSPEAAMRWRYLSHLVLLYILQFPIASLPTTVFLGNQLFFESMSMRQLIKRILPTAARWLLVLGVFRLGLITLFLEFFVNRDLAFDARIELWILFFISGLGLVIRACWPFAPEILGLELCPLRRSRGGESSYRQRSSVLHRQLVADNISRWVAAATYGTLLTCMLLGVALFLQGVITGDWQWNAWFDHLYVPLALWLVGLFMAVFRFLSYLDARIRLEGWEIELGLKAEGLRLQQAGRPTVTTTLTAEQVAS